jgi:membrane fusion protein (multidrug efflux system)
MSIHFSRSLRRLEADGSRRTALILLITIVALIAWTTWFVSSRVAVYATTTTARLEVDREGHTVDTPVAGRVLAASLTAGRRVNAGDVLLQLDAAAERLAQGEAQAKLGPSARQRASLRDELNAAESALAQQQQAAVAAQAEADAKVQETAAAADLAAEEARRLTELRKNGLVSELEHPRAEKIAEERRGEARSSVYAASRLKRDLDAQQQDRVGRIARLRNELAGIDSVRDEATAAANRLQFEITQREVRAPISGTIAEVAPLKVGTVVSAGDRICTIVPDGLLKVVASFAPSVALGRVREGQPARVRLEGFPWTQYGAAAARVSNVAGEIRDGSVRVELTLTTRDSPIPFQHGLPAEVDVEVDRLSPMVMVLRAAGARLSLSASTATTSAR